MSILWIISFALLAITIFFLIDAWITLNRAQKHIQSAIKVCEDAVTSLRAGKG